jgi:hypothetical protein
MDQCINQDRYMSISCQITTVYSRQLTKDSNVNHQARITCIVASQYPLSAPTPGVQNKWPCI